jgi:hypothetical protein
MVCGPLDPEMKDPVIYISGGKTQNDPHGLEALKHNIREAIYIIQQHE